MRLLHQKKPPSPRPVIVIGRSSPGKRSRARVMEQEPRQKAKRRSFCIESRLRPAFRPFEKSLRCHTPFLVQQPMINMYVMQSFAARIGLWKRNGYLIIDMDCPPATAVLYPAVLRRSNKGLGAEWIFDGSYNHLTGQKLTLLWLEMQGVFFRIR